MSDDLAEQVASEWPLGGEQRDLSLLAHEVLRMRTRIEEMESVMKRAADIIDKNLYHQREKVEDASALLRSALTN